MRKTLARSNKTRMKGALLKLWNNSNHFAGTRMLRFLKWALIAFVAVFAFAYFVADKPPTQKTAALSSQQVKAQAGFIGYDLLARSPTYYEGRLVSFQGKVIQAAQSGLSYVLRVNISRGKYDIWNDTIYVDYRANSGSEPRILVGDIVQLWGEFVGIKSYTAVLGQTIQIPYVVARVVESAH